MRDESKSSAVPPPALTVGYTCTICGATVPVLSTDEARPEGVATKTATAHKYRPFCSARCQRIDLGNWLDERYVVPGPPVSPEEEEGTPESTG